ncbi:hypothetical protein GCM10027403_17360 [Arthrobacter tecti]
MSSTTTDPVRLRESSTGLLQTTVTAGKNGALWTHHLGEMASFPFSSLSIRLDTPLDSITFGIGDATRRAYQTSTTATVPDLLATGENEALFLVGRWWGQALSMLHANADADADADTMSIPPRTLTRAQAWTAGQWPVVGGIIGDDGLRTIRAWTEDMLKQDHNRLVVVHGSPGMAHWTVAPDGSRAALLTGEDTGFADASYDAVWVMGELAELHHFYPSIRPGIARLRQGFQDGHGTLPDPGTMRVGIAFRLLQHAYDWHHYAGASIENAQLVIRLADSYLRGPSTSNGEPS